MYSIKVYETAIQMCGYTLLEIKRANRSSQISSVIGLIQKRVPRMITGKKEYISQEKKVRWNSEGKCFTLRYNSRLRKYDLPLASAHESLKLQEEDLCM